MHRFLKLSLYRIVKHLVEKPDGRITRFAYVSLSLSCFYIIRLMIVIVMEQHSEWHNPFEADYLWRFATTHTFQYNTFLGVFRILAEGLNLVGTSTLYRSSVESFSYKILYQFVVVNPEAYLKCIDEEKRTLLEREKAKQFHKKLTERYPKLSYILPLGRISKVMAKFSVWYRMEALDKRKFQRRSLPLFPSLSYEHRTRLIVIQSVMGFIIFHISIFFGKS